MTPFGRSGRSPLDLAATAHQDLERRHPHLPLPDHLIVSTQDPGAFAELGNVAAAVTDALGLGSIAATRVEAAPASGLAALEVATALVRSGQRDAVLIVGVETMTTLGSTAANQVLSRMADPLERAYGLTMAAMVAFITRAHLETHRLPTRLLDEAAAKAHDLGRLNPHAQFQKAQTAADIQATPMIADPLRRGHSAPLSDGAACVLITAGPGPVRVRGIGHATDALSLTHRHGRRALIGFAATRNAAHEAYTRAGLGARDVDVIETHDAFSGMEGINLEDLGFYPPGKGMSAVAAGATRPGGAHPTNCGGGLKARGHPVGATGVAMLAELFWQLTGDVEVDERAACLGRTPRIGLAHNMGGLANNVCVALLEARS